MSDEARDMANAALLFGAIIWFAGAVYILIEERP